MSCDTLTPKVQAELNNLPGFPPTEEFCFGDFLATLVSGGGLTPATHRALDQLVHSVAETSFMEILRTSGLVSDVIYWTDNTKVQKIRETVITRTSNQVSQIVVRQYDSAGVVAETLTGTFTRVAGQVSSVDWVLT